jgi:hypothetical protein
MRHPGKSSEDQSSRPDESIPAGLVTGLLLLLGLFANIYIAYF